MTAFPSYSTGTVAIGSGATTVVGTGSNWTGQNAMPGDLLVVAGNSVIVQDVTDALTLAIDAWPFAAVTAGTAYKLYKVSPLRFAGGQAMADVSTLVAALNTDGFYVFVGPDLSVPDPSYGNDDQYAFQATTGKLWQKTGGTWNFIGTQKGFGTPAPWSSSTAYLPFDVVSFDGTSYVCILANTNQTPPNATYWVVLAEKGETGAKGDTGPAAWTAPAAWVTGHAYVAGPPASVVVQAGETYVCLVSHTSGTFATDLAASKWIKVAQKGSGDLSSSNNLSDLANAATARTNLGSTTVGDALFVAANAAAGRTTLGLATIAASGSASDLSTGTVPLAQRGYSMPDVIIEEQQAAGTAAGASTSGSFVTRLLNTQVRNAGSIASFPGSAQFSLGAGTYYMSWSAPAFFSLQHQTRIQNITDSTTVASGTSEYSDNNATGVPPPTRSFGSTVVTITGTKTFALQHRVGASRATNGLGTPCNFGIMEVYSRIEITKLG